MHLLSVNVGQPTALHLGDKEFVSGICKTGVPGRVSVGALGLAGDHIVSTKHHGGPDQAVYLYSARDYDWWAEQLGEAIEPGTFGENLTLSSFGEGDLRVGDRYHVGEVTLEVTAPRIPCATFAARMGNAQFVKKFRQAKRPGVYARVLRAGTVGAGDPVEREAASAHFPTIAEMFEVWYETNPTRDQLERLLAAPIALRARQGYEELLGKRA